MATSNNSDYNCCNIPQWKKELILRRRTFGRAISSAGGMMLTVTCPSSLRADSVSQNCSKHQHQLQQLQQQQQEFLSESSVKTMRLLDADLTSDLIVSSVKCNSDCLSDVKVKMVEEKPIKKSTYKSMDKQKDGNKRQMGRVFSGIKQNGKDDEYQSDSSEELQYGPGIVNKLKSKYLSMTLRDNHKHSVRPSLANLRRATSLENMLEDESIRNQDKPHFIKKAYHSSTHKGVKISQHHAKYLGLTRGSESMKRARSMDTLLKNDLKPHTAIPSPPFTSKTLNKFNNSNLTVAPSIINEDIIIVDNNAHTSEEEKFNNLTLEDKELPPMDVVKQTVKIFEPFKNTKSNDCAGKKSNFIKLLNSNNQTSKVNNIEKSSMNKLVKPSLSPKPTLSPEKRYLRPKVTSPKRVVVPVVTSIKETPKTPEIEKEPNIFPKVLNSPIKKSSPASIKSSPPPPPPPPPPLPNNNKSPTSSPTKQAPLPPKQLPISPTSPIKRCISPLKMSPVPPVLTSLSSPPSHHNHHHHHINNINNNNNNNDLLNEEPFKFISQKSIDGITKESTTVTFSFNESPIALNKSYLPTRSNNVVVAQATNTALISSAQQCGSPPPVNNPPESTTQTASPTKQVAIIRPVLAPQNNIQNLTEVEIEKNLINTVKSIETKIISSTTPTTKNNEVEISKITNCVSEKSQLWEKKPWQSQNTMVFNFSSRDTVPDYIENDGLSQMKRTTKFNGTKDETDICSGDEDWEPPSICNIRFIGDNVVINGKSNLRKEPKQHKLRIQFNDEATTMFEYPSEDSLNEEATTPNNLPVSAPPAIPLVGSTLSSYTPSKSGKQDIFELGVTRTTPIVTQQSQQSPQTSTTTTGEKNDLQEFLKPANTENETTWSQENTADILF